MEFASSRLFALIISLISVVAACGNGASGQPAPKEYEWSRELPATDHLAERRGLSVMRATIHGHSLYSHDACDGKPFIDGEPNEECLSQLRDALCATRQDALFLTDHNGNLAWVENFDDAFLHRDGDEWVSDGEGRHVASRERCEDGHEVLWLVGSENTLMPVGLFRHPGNADLTAEQRASLYDTADPETVAAMKDAGAVVLIAHTEKWTPEQVSALDVAGIEIFNAHAALDPIKRQEDLGVDPAKGASEFAKYVFHPEEMPHPDFAIFGFLERFDRYFSIWDAVLARRKVAGLIGNDMHQNVMKTPCSDGERPDGYRRMMRWMGNHLLVSERSAAGAKETVEKGRYYGVFEALGTPQDFDFFASTPSGTAEMGETVEAGSGVTLRVKLPGLLDLDPRLAPAMRAVLYRVGPDGVEKAGEASEDFSIDSPEPGAYRVEVFCGTAHLLHLFGSQREEYDHEYPFIYSNPIYVDKRREK